jgi:hypothetical protein
MAQSPHEPKPMITTCANASTHHSRYRSPYGAPMVVRTAADLEKYIAPGALGRPFVVAAGPTSFAGCAANKRLGCGWSKTGIMRKTRVLSPPNVSGGPSPARAQEYGHCGTTCRAA